MAQGRWPVVVWGERAWSLGRKTEPHLILGGKIEALLGALEQQLDTRMDRVEEQ